MKFNPFRKKERLYTVYFTSGKTMKVNKAFTNGIETTLLKGMHYYIFQDKFTGFYQFINISQVTHIK